MRGIVSATIVFVLCLAILVGLGVWQLQRLEWKTKLIADLTERSGKPPVAWQSSDLPPAEFTHVAVTGELRNDRPLLVYGRTQNGAPGVHVLAALLPTNGPAVLIDEGFVPLPVDSFQAQSDVMYNVTVDGLARNGGEQNWFEADNSPGRNQWFWMDLPRMARALGVEALAPVYIEAVQPIRVGGPAPAGGLLLGQIRNEHLTYAITWFSFAGILVIIYAVWLFGRIDRRNPLSRV